MKLLIYFSNSRFPFAGAAAAIHLDLLPGNSFRVNTTWRKMLYQSQDRQKKGKLFYTGKDRRGNEIYAIWDAGPPAMVRKMILSFLDLYGAGHEEIFFVNTDLRDTGLSRLSCWLCSIPFTRPRGELLAAKVLQDNFIYLTAIVGKISPENLTEQAAYQIMLP